MKSKADIRAAEMAAAADRKAADAEFIAKCSHALYRFMKAHAHDQEGGISPCEANMRMIDEKMDELLLDGTDPQTYEILLLSLGSKLVRVKDPEIPMPEPPKAAPPEPVLSESDALRKLLRDNKGASPREIANLMRAQLKTSDAHDRAAQLTLPPSVTKQRLMKDKELLKSMLHKFGNTAVNDRLNGRN